MYKVDTSLSKIRCVANNCLSDVLGDGYVED